MNWRKLSSQIEVANNRWMNETAKGTKEKKFKEYNNDADRQAMLISLNIYFYHP